LALLGFELRTCWADLSHTPTRINISLLLFDSLALGEANHMSRTCSPLSTGWQDPGIYQDTAAFCPRPSQESFPGEVYDEVIREPPSPVLWKSPDFGTIVLEESRNPK
jgi:hypothetical protein